MGWLHPFTAVAATNLCSCRLDLTGDTGTGSTLGNAGQNAQAASHPGGYHHMVYMHAGY